MTFDPKKPVRTRDGHHARIICTDKRGAYPIVALVSDGGIESPCTYTINGEFSTSRENTPLDLINAPERKTRWLNVYDDVTSESHNSRGDADKARSPDALGLVSLTFEGGKLVSFKNHPLDGGDDE